MASGRSDIGQGRMAGEDENLTIWSDTETALFLKIWRRPDVQTALRQYTRKRPIWKKVSAELAAEGYRRSAEQCKSKMHNLMTSYRRVKKGVDPESRCKFFAVIDQVMTSPEFEAATAGAAGIGGDGLDMDGETSEESGPSTSGLSDYAHSHSVSPGGGREDSSTVDTERGRCAPWRPVPVRPSETPVYPPTRDRSAHRDEECDQPPRKRYCNWEERYQAELSAAGGHSSHTVHPAHSGHTGHSGHQDELARGRPTYLDQRAMERPPHHSTRDLHHEDIHAPHDLRVTSHLPPEPRVAPQSPPEQRVTSQSPPEACPPLPPMLDDSRGFSHARDLIAERARQLLSALPGHPELHSDEPITNGHARHREENGGIHDAPPADDRTATSLERMETLLQELVDMQRAFLLSEERRRREQLIREENWRMQDKEFLVRLAQTLANSQH